MEKGFRVRLYPKPWQEEILFEFCRDYHRMWNILVGRYDSKNLPHVNKLGIRNYSPDQFMRDYGIETVPQRIVLAVMKTYANAVNRVYNKLANPPKFHKFNPNRQSFYLASIHWKIDLKDGTIALPTREWKKCAKSKRIKMDMDYILKQGITEVREPHFIYKNGKWFLSGCYIVEDVKKKNINKFLGLDWGIKNFFTTNEGVFINFPPSVLREFQRCNKLKSYMDKKKYRSKNYEKLKIKFGKARRRLSYLQKDFIEKTTTNLCENYNVVVEELSYYALNSNRFVRRMNVIYPHDSFIARLRWKAKKFGTEFIMIDPAYTSKTCCKCGLVHEDMTLKDRVMVCECGNVMDRDVNAAINIMNAGKTAMGVCCTY